MAGRLLSKMAFVLAPCATSRSAYFFLLFLFVCRERVALERMVNRFLSLFFSPPLGKNDVVCNHRTVTLYLQFNFLGGWAARVFEHRPVNCVVEPDALQGLFRAYQLPLIS